MVKTNPMGKRSIITVAVMIAMAVIGMIVINLNRVEADSSVLFKQESTEVASVTTGYQSPTVMPSLYRIGGALALVIACIYAGIFLLKKVTGQRYSPGHKGSLMEVVETLYIAPKKTVSLIRVVDRTVLIGITEEHISVLSELDEKETEIIKASLQSDEEPEKFGNMLRLASSKLVSMAGRKNRPAIDKLAG